MDMGAGLVARSADETAIDRLHGGEKHFPPFTDDPLTDDGYGGLMAVNTN